MDLGFNDEQIERYSRHILLEEVGGIGQRRLLDSKALMIGAGGLGSPALLYLGAAGIGTIGIIDHDKVELSNLQRQVIHAGGDLGRSKAASARESIEALNPDCKIIAHPERLDLGNVLDVIRGYDVVLDGTDNFGTRFLVADACRMEGIPLISAAVLRFHGQLMTILPGPGNPCYRCIFPEPPPPGLAPSCSEAGVLGAVVGVMGTLQATEALKILLGVGNVLSDKLLIYDALEASFMTVKRAVDPGCPLCGEKATITSLAEYDYSCELSAAEGRP